jgi:hypothetical protein
VSLDGQDVGLREQGARNDGDTVHQKNQKAK